MEKNRGPSTHFKDASYVFYVADCESNNLYQIMVSQNFQNIYHFQDPEVSEKGIVADVIVLDTDFYMQNNKVKLVKLKIFYNK